MDRPAPQPPQQRDLVYCHECDNEWYRDEHGMTPCPECGGEFTEVIEEDHDPREEQAPDPEEEDIDHFEFRNNGPGEAPGGHIHGTVNRTIRLNASDLLRQQGAQGGQGGLAGMITGLLGPTIQNLIGANQAQQQQPDHTQRQQGQDPNTLGTAPQGQQPGSGRTFVQHGQGTNYSFTITTSSSANIVPRDANAPQPFQQQPDNINHLMAQMFQNIGTQPGGPGTFRFGPPPAFNENDDMHFGGGGMPGGPFNLGNIFRMFGPPGGVHGDAVYSQEAMDRIVTQLMEQHQTGHAPGPATEQAIDTLPRRAISERDLDEQGKAECTICMDAVDLGTTVTVLPCEHWFHFECIKSWLVEHDTCPHCRQGIMPRNDEQNGGARQPSQAPLHDMNSTEYHNPSMPGGFPSSHQGATSAESGDLGDGSRDHPFTVPESPNAPRESSSSGMFDRMRDTFGGDGSGTGDSSSKHRP